jgi:hypothetical protein
VLALLAWEAVWVSLESLFRRIISLQSCISKCFLLSLRLLHLFFFNPLYFLEVRVSSAMVKLPLSFYFVSCVFNFSKRFKQTTFPHLSWGGVKLVRTCFIVIEREPDEAKPITPYTCISCFMFLFIFCPCAFNRRPFVLSFLYTIPNFHLCFYQPDSSFAWLRHYCLLCSFGIPSLV